MPDLDLSKNDIPFWAGGSGSVRVHVNAPDLDRQLDQTDDDLLKVEFNMTGGQSFALGAPDSVKLGIKAATSVRLVPLWAASAPERLRLLEAYGLGSYFSPAENHADRLLVLFTVGASADGSVSGTFKYNVLSLNTSLDAGADASYALVRSYPLGVAARALVNDFFRGLRLPANVSAPLAEGEVIVFEYGGYLRFNASLSAGYELSGAHSFEISQLAFSEKYAFSLLGKLSLSASVAGRFKVEVRQGTGDGWTRVTVRKSNTRTFSLAADVDASATFEQEGLPEAPDEFISALIGLNSKNWLNMFTRVSELTDFKNLEAYLDELAKSFIEKYTEKAFDALADRTALDEMLARVNRVVAAYNDLGDHAVALFDRYFDVARGAVDDRLETSLRAVQDAADWDAIKARLNSPGGEILWDIVNQLTEGDPLGWMLGRINLGGQSVNSLDELKQRADKALDLIQNQAHGEIRRLVALAKSEFPLDRFLRELGNINWTDLKNMADRRLVGFVERLIGKSVAGLSNSELGKVVTKLHEILDSIEHFKTTLYAKARAALDESFQFHLHLEYSRAAERDALLDFELDLNTEAGRRLMKAAGHGDFGRVLVEYGTGAVRLREGVLTHKVTKQSTLSVNVVGWHLDWHYQGLDRIITQAEQRLIPAGNGGLNVISTFDLQKESERKRNGERVYTNLLLRFIGESKGKVEFDAANQQYLVDAITGMSARYNLVIDDPSTTQQELAQYLSFADDFGLTTSDEATEAALVPLLPTDAQGNYGDLSVKYDVRFTEDGLRSLFAQQFAPSDEVFVRRVMRLITLANYVNKEPGLAALAWSYWTPGVREVWAANPATFMSHSTLTLEPIAPSPFKNLAAPPRVVAHKSDLEVLNLFYRIEDDLIDGLRDLSAILQAPGRISPREFEKRLGAFGRALKNYDNVDKGENTVFAVFDKLIQRSAPMGVYRGSSLTITSQLDGKKTTKMLIA
jgi:hypothetical protein